MYGKCDLKTWENECDHCQLIQSDLLFLIFHYWLHKPLSITMVREMLNLYKIINSTLNIYKNDGNFKYCISNYTIFSKPIDEI